MTAIQKFMLAHPHGYIKDSELAEVIRLERLQLLLVRCGSCRFLAPAQDVNHIMRALEIDGDYVRDVSFPASSMDEARKAHAQHVAHVGLVSGQPVWLDPENVKHLLTPEENEAL